MNQVEIYQTRDKQAQVEVKFEEDTVWLSQQQMASLFKQTKHNISLHINNCLREKELAKKATVKESLTAQKQYAYFAYIFFKYHDQFNFSAGYSNL
jgi:hypothetical protein